MLSIHRGDGITIYAGEDVIRITTEQPDVMRLAIEAPLHIRIIRDRARVRNPPANRFGTRQHREDSVDESPS